LKRGNTAEGTTPKGTQDERQASNWVQNMFAEIAPRYDLLNHLLSFNIDRVWRKALVGHMKPVLARPEAKILDLCCGTGDVMLDLQRVSTAYIMGADFCHPMLVSAQKKAARENHAASLLEADALALPISDSSLDAISIAFGFRNLTNYASGFQELHRVLKPGGMLALLEFSHPPGKVISGVYGFYSRAILPFIGSLVSGSREAYSYLPESIEKFPRAPELLAMMDTAGFRQSRCELLSGGIAALHTGVRN
jgi:demethylmenaquinone methyltransferase / 2-methoxy-6-polyprenyl-1,4-benzoquinol methylase